MHHTHVHEDLLLMYILFARRTHKHEGTFPIFTLFSLMHIAKIHVTHCLLCHDYALTWSYVPYLHDCIHVGGAYECYMSFQSFTYLSLYIYSQKKLNIYIAEGTSAPRVILVINVNISLVGLILLPSMFQISSTMERHGLENGEPPSTC